MATKITGLKEIAFELNISINTVSRALRDCDDISDITKEKVRNKACELGYLPNSVSQFIKRNGKKLIALVINSFSNSYFSIMCSKLLPLIIENNCDFTVVVTLSKRLGTDVIKQCISQRVDAIISFLEPNDDAITSAKMNEIPITVIGRKVNKEYIDEVYTNDEQGGSLAADYLINFHHISKFVYVRISNIECSRRRYKSFEKQLKKYFDQPDLVIVESQNLDKDIPELIEKGYNGLFCFNDEIAYRVLSLLNEKEPNFRMHYPHFHLVGFDNISSFSKGMVDISSISYDYDAIAQTTLDLTLSRIQKPNRYPEKRIFPVMFHKRKYL